MKKLKDILKLLQPIQIIGNTERDIESISNNSNAVQPNSLFVAIKGLTVDAHQFIPQAIQKGSIAIVCEKNPENLMKDVTYIQVKDSAEALGIIAHEFYDKPTHKLNLIGVTGTNGKTTTVTLLFQLFRSLGYSCGLISTVENKINDKTLSATHTTPDALQFNQLLHQMMQEGCQYVFTEVSSIGVHQKRIAGLHFKGGIFTNLTHDHLDYHKTFENYRDCKKAFFDALSKDSFALINKDDKNGMYMVQNTSAQVYTYALQTMADFKAKILEQHINGTLIQINGKDVWIKLIGKFNVYNVLTAYSVARILGEEEEKILKYISNLNPARGRFQMIHHNGITGIVDYAHTPDALENVLKTIKELRHDHQNIITIIGCGGNRDAAKRPIMAQIASKYSDKVILTSDNPRNEDPKEIIQQMEHGLTYQDKRKTIRIVDRDEAIHVAVQMAENEDIILLAGKGHETYQEINGVKYPFDDYQKLSDYLKQMK
ncbi:MAG: UDP-N-acetylmuramoyl-L-alanyl-D-glutamate--2,6-diaminopimelate ligase [Bacteroidia bacterium]|nr:MAG: UDP-N-acetylmuramoyl-L-alanyl-D-glutamate--2,6-diaminopimelate ligase [Bacteroidia bacterium]